ncbi:MAG: ABC transporter ATP-binding protein [bacterium]
MLRIEAICKNYNHRMQTIAALREISLDINKGEFISVVGPSGSGKSTLLLTVGGMLTPSSGRVFLYDESLYELSPDERARIRREKIGFLFQTFNLVPYLSALENVQISLYLRGRGEEVQQKKATALLERVGLGDRLDHKPSELSVGEQQRVALARALANDPEIILADEPTGNLDPDTREQIMALLSSVNEEGRTVIVVTHDPQVAAMAHKTLRLVGGSVTM